MIFSRLEKWKKYVGFSSNEAMKEEYPGPMITPGSTKNRDSEQTTSVPVEVWDKLAEWFSVEVA